MKISNVFIFLVIAAVSFAAGFLVNGNLDGKKVSSIVNEVTETLPIARPLERYQIEALSDTAITPGQIRVNEILDETPEFTSYLFFHTFDPNLTGTSKKTVSGQINLPSSSGKKPLIIMLRGFVSQKIYVTGIGTKRAAEVFAKNGYITVAPDFLGYADSDKESENIFETRFQTYTTVLSILESLSSVKEWDGKNIFIWAHSNGGQVALTTLTVTKRNIPTTLWAPVTKPFPYSILYYTDESADRGKYIRSELAEFEDLYDVEKFSFDNYLDRLAAPIQLHQGTNDDAIPVAWSSSIISQLKLLDKDATLYIYPSADHNLTPGWDEVVARDLEFFRSHIQ